MASELLVGSWRKHLLTYQEFTHSSPVTRRSPRVFRCALRGDEARVVEAFAGWLSSQSASENSGMRHAVRASRRDKVAIMAM